MIKSNALRAAFVALAVAVVVPQQSLLEAQSNNCTCQGEYWGYLPLVLLDPVCVHDYYSYNFYSFTPDSCAASCAGLASTLAASSCGTECEREGTTFQVVRYSWSGVWSYFLGPNGSHGQTNVAC